MAFWRATLNLFSILVYLIGYAQFVPAPRPIAPLLEPHPAGPDDPQELAAFLEPVFASHMTASRIPGAVFLFVKDGQVFYSHGFGYADVDKNISVDPQDTIWRVMSVSKSLTAMAVMQLVEQGRLDLDADIRPLFPRILTADRFPEPLSARQVLSHNAGLDFDLQDIGGEAPDPSRLLTLEQFLSEHPPRRAFPPGRQYLYSNVAFDLAGALVETLSGQDYLDYMDSRIFQPLGMKSSSYRQPPPGQARLAQGYEFLADELSPVPFPLFQDPPSRSMTANAADMGRLILTLLKNGPPEADPVLQPESIDELFKPTFSYKPGTPGYAMGFVETFRPGLRILSKDGAGSGANSHLVLLPAEDLGYFLAYNLDDDLDLANDLFDRFLDHYYPILGPGVPPPSHPPEKLADLEGRYRSTRYSRTSLSKLDRLTWADDIRVSAAPGGWLEVRFEDRDEPVRMAEIAPLHFLTQDGKQHFVFQSDAGGRVRYFAAGPFVAEKTAWYESGPFHYTLLLVFLFLFLAAGIGFTLLALRKHRSKITRSPDQAPPSVLFWLPAAVAWINLVCMAVLLVELSVGTDFSYGMPPGLAALFVVLLANCILTLALPVLTIFSWLRRAPGVKTLAFYTFFSLAALLFIPWLSYWNLLGFRW